MILYFLLLKIMLSEREAIQEEIFNEVNKMEDFEASLQEEVDANDRPAPIYNYKDPNHKPPFKNGEDYTEFSAHSNEEVNAIAFGTNGVHLKNITEKNGIAYLYHMRETNKIGIWGESRKFDRVTLDIEDRYNNAIIYLNQKKMNEKINTEENTEENK